MSGPDQQPVAVAAAARRVVVAAINALPADVFGPECVTAGQSLIGLHPLTMLVTTEFADMDVYGVYADKTATDEQWQTFWAGVMADPTADLIRSGLFVNISGD